MNKTTLFIISGILIVFVALIIWRQWGDRTDDELNTGLPPEGCTTWFDGCNTCQVGEVGAPMACTLMACAEIQKPYCIKYEDGSSDTP